MSSSDDGGCAAGLFIFLALMVALFSPRFTGVDPLVIFSGALFVFVVLWGFMTTLHLAHPRVVMRRVRPLLAALGQVR